MGLSGITDRIRPAVLVSLGVHAAVFALFLVGELRPVSHIVGPATGISIARLETAGGSPLRMRPDFVFPGPPHVNPQRLKNELTHTANPARPIHHVHSAATAPLTASTGRGSGSADHGNGSDAEDAMPAFPVFSPRPAITDRSLLPATEQKVVVDVKLSADGTVLDETLVKGLGNRLDTMVMDIVKTWRFHPATIDGKPVASEAECIFPFDLNYPVSGG